MFSRKSFGSRSFNAQSWAGAAAAALAVVAGAGGPDEAEAHAIAAGKAGQRLYAPLVADVQTPPSLVVPQRVQTAPAVTPNSRSELGLDDLKSMREVNSAPGAELHVAHHGEADEEAMVLALVDALDALDRADAQAEQDEEEAIVLALVELELI